MGVKVPLIPQVYNVTLLSAAHRVVQERSLLFELAGKFDSSSVVCIYSRAGSLRSSETGSGFSNSCYPSQAPIWDRWRRVDFCIVSWH